MPILLSNNILNTLILPVILSLIITAFNSKASKITFLIALLINFLAPELSKPSNFDASFINLYLFTSHLFIIKSCILILALSTIFNFYSLNKFQLIFRHLLLLGTLLGCYANNWLIMLLAIEILTITTCLQFFTTRGLYSLEYFIKYLAICIFSSSLILTGISYDNLWLIEFNTHIFNHNLLTLFGILIHLGILPITLTITSYNYTNFDARTLLPLFISKLLLLIIVTQFNPSGILLFLGIATLIYALVILLFSKNLYKTAIGFILVDIGFTIASFSLSLVTPIIFTILIAAKLPFIYLLLEHIRLLNQQNINNFSDLKQQVNLRGFKPYKTNLFIACALNTSVPIFADGLLKQRIFESAPDYFKVIIIITNLACIIGIFYKFIIINQPKNNNPSTFTPPFSLKLLGFITTIVILSNALLSIFTFKKIALNLVEFNYLAKYFSLLLLSFVIYKILNFFSLFKKNFDYEIDSIYLAPLKILFKQLNYISIIKTQFTFNTANVFRLNTSSNLTILLTIFSIGILYILKI
ncbi:hypothetical protein [Rickettsiales endosymbiont of Stachyamoeba lipophora]|uniref:hypothetical protein n=1 Tax=Rickettsiales endosymbiont of Stachyamoeba lipophora TaxID=2486578 RepID=UPI000F64B033|nr:hypothetical protein [Rickettsiales endosymbiont of Stachyamoeba lipophora]AZL15361.1 hypothetical protein EF513_02165 [Rickettsiales endosymbiont of Stachyamoeba lipophora]